MSLEKSSWAEQPRPGQRLPSVAPSNLTEQMQITSGTNFHIFRGGRKSAFVADLATKLANCARSLPASPSLDALISLLLRSGELECALRDIGSPDADNAEELTDHLAEAAIRRQNNNRRDGVLLAQRVCPLLDRIRPIGSVSVATPEGFAYYALHPLDYADLVMCSPVNAPSAFVVGIRSIGTTLSAVVAAQLRAVAVSTERTTVRPTGHPYDRRCEFDSSQTERVRRAVAGNAAFLVCDEGPGRSGSSLLSTAEALERDGVPRGRIILLCSHEPQSSGLCTPHGARRWARFRAIASGRTARLPADAAADLGGGEWRARFIDRREPWPAAWPQMERLKFLSRDGERVLKLEGHGHYGEQVRTRNECLAASGLGAPYLGQAFGFGSYAFVKGRMSSRRDLTDCLLARMADYCAWRSREFAVPEADSSDLETMARVNLEREFGRVAELDLRLERPVIADGRMQPHEWFFAADGRWLKLDGATHGDDHFFPGPCDIAWDLAGIIVEWGLDRAAKEGLLHKYAQSTGDHVIPRIDGYVLAYAAFRFAWSRMAADSVGEAEERKRLLCDYQQYRTTAETCQARRTNGYRILRRQPRRVAARPHATPER